MSHEEHNTNDSPSVIARDGDYTIEIVECSHIDQSTRPYQGCWPDSMCQPAEPLEFKSFKEAFGIPTSNKE